MKTVAQIVRSKKDAAVHTVAPTASVLSAIKKMALHGIGALLVVENEQIVGIVTERDYARKVVLMGRSSHETAVREIMSAPVMFVHPDHTSHQCMALMTGNRLRHLPVLDQGRLVGLVSIGDLVADIISDQQFTIEQLEHYIMGDRA